MKTNIVTEKECSRCGKTKPIDDFGKHKKSIDGHRRICNACRGVEEPQAEDPRMDEPLPNRSHIMVLDFSDYPDILESIKGVAKNNIRTPEQQAIYMLKRFCDSPIP